MESTCNKKFRCILSSGQRATTQQRRKLYSRRSSACDSNQSPLVVVACHARELTTSHCGRSLRFCGIEPQTALLTFSSCATSVKLKPSCWSLAASSSNRAAKDERLAPSRWHPGASLQLTHPKRAHLQHHPCSQEKENEENNCRQKVTTVDQANATSTSIAAFFFSLRASTAAQKK